MNPDIDCADLGCCEPLSRGGLDGILEGAYPNSLELLQFGFNSTLCKLSSSSVNPRTLEFEVHSSR